MDEELDYLVCTWQQKLYNTLIKTTKN